MTSQVRVSLLDRLLATPVNARFAAVALLLVGIFVVDHTTPNLTLGVAYILPVILASTFIGAPGIIALAVLCGIARVSGFPTGSAFDTGMRGLFSTIAYAATGLFVLELVRNRRLSLNYVSSLEKHQVLRREAEEQLRLLAESSPAAIFTLDADTRVLSANRATNQLLGFDSDAVLTGEPIGSYLPVLVDALQIDPAVTSFRTATQCAGRRRNQDPFFAQIWFSTYNSGKGRRLAAIAVDNSDEVREREEHNLKQLLDNNRIIAGAVSDELRNICGAAAVTYKNLERVPDLSRNRDFQNMGGLIRALEWIATIDLKHSHHLPSSPTDPLEVLNQLRIVVDPAWSDMGGSIRWNVAASLPKVEAEPIGLLQSLLAIAQSSRTAVEADLNRRLEIKAYSRSGSVQIEFLDSSRAHTDCSGLFLPFRGGSKTLGLDLYVSRAIIRGYGGDLKYDPFDGFSRFTVELRAASGQDERG